MAVVWRPGTSRPPDLIIFQRARRRGRVVRCLSLSTLKQLGLRPFSSKLTVVDNDFGASSAFRNALLPPQ